MKDAPDPIEKHLFSFRGGVQNKRANPLDVAEDALVGGLNVDLSDGAIRTRPGYSIVSDNSLPKGEVMALAQVRFPSNEISRLVAQVRDSGIAYEFPASQTPPASRIYHAVCYDPENNYTWVFSGQDVAGNVYYNDLWYFAHDTLTWHEVTDATNHPAWCTSTNDMVYDAANGRLVIYVGRTFQSDGTWIANANEWWAYNIGANSFEQITTSILEGEALCLYSGMTGWREHSRMILRSGVVWLIGGRNNEGSFEVASFCTLDLSTGVYSGILPENYLDGPLARYGHAIAWNDDDSELMVVGGYTTSGYLNDAWRLFFLGEEWAWEQVDDLPVTGEVYVDQSALVYCSGKYWSIGTSAYHSVPELGSAVLSDVAWVYVNDAWESCQFVNEPAGRGYTKAIVEGTNIWLILGATTTIDPDTSELVLVPGAELLAEMCEWEPATGGATISTSRLYASKDHLPTTTATFTEIYDLGDADRVSFAVLNNRVVITEGKATVPLAWGGCMEADLSDGMYPKAVIVTQDGEHFYDVSSQVCDPDLDTVADIGLISASGYLAVCTESPLVDAFYFEMETPNTVDTEDPGNQQTSAITFFDATTVVVEDLKGTIDAWVQDSGVTGHFEDAGNNPLTLGPGNACPDVEAGLNVVMASNEPTIMEITPDGEGSGEVELSESLAGQTVTSVIGLSADSGALISPSGYSPVTSTWAKTPTGGLPVAGYSIRQVLSGADISTSGDQCRLTLKIGYVACSFGLGGVWPTGINATLRGATHHPLAYQICANNPPGLWVMISRISIGERSGSTANTTTTPQEVTFPFRPNWGSVASPYAYNTHPSYATATSDGSLHLTICHPMAKSGQTVTSDWINFPIDQTKDYIVVLDCMDVWIRNYYRACPLYRSAGAGYYYLTGEANAPETWNVADVSTQGFTFQDGYTVGVVQVDVRDKYPLPTQILAAHSTDIVQFSLTSIENFRKLEANETKPESSQVYHAVSLDGRATFQVFKDDAWRTIVRFSSVWQYLDGSNVWQNATEDTLLRALKETFAVTENQMIGTELAAITADQWMGTGGITLRVTTTMDFAVGILCDTADTPTLSGYTATYNDAGETSIQGYSGNKWTVGAGWTDGTMLDGVPWGQNGVVSYDSEDPFEAQHFVLNEVPGFWYRFKSNGTAENTAVTRVMYSGPCQPLSNISDGQPDIPLAMIFHDVSKDTKKDVTIEVSGAQGSFTTDEDGDVTYVAGKATLPITTEDYLYLGYLQKFHAAEFTPYDGYENAVDASLGCEYWNGIEWTAIDITDDTLGTDADHLKTMSAKGKITWFVPDDWKMMIPFNADFPRGYYLRFQPSANLTSTTAIDEVRVYAVPDALKKHRFAVSFRDRIALVSRPDAPDQVDISRALEEYGFTGEDSGSYRVGGMDSLQCAVSAWNRLMLGKTESLHQLQGQSPADFSWEGVEAAGLVPINGRSCIKASTSGIGTDGNRHGLFFLNQSGAYCATGLQVDGTFNTSRGQALSELTNWWTRDAVPRLDTKNLHIACGALWPVRNWLVWSVPMIVATGQTTQTTNNRLIVYDLTLNAWLPPMDIPVASLCLAYDYVEDSPGHIGPAALLAGDYLGRILRLFEATSDNGTDIAWSVETGWLSFGMPDWEKRVRWMHEYGSNENDMTLTAYANGNTTTPAYTGTIDALTSPTGFFTMECADQNIHGNFLKFILSGTGVSSIFGMQMSLLPVRQIPGGQAT